MAWIECKQRGTARCLKQLLQDRVRCRLDSPSVNPLDSDSRFQILSELRPAQAQGRRVRGDQSPEAGGNRGVEKVFDLANIDGGAGVRNSRDNMGDVREMNGAVWG